MAGRTTPPPPRASNRVWGESGRQGAREASWLPLYWGAAGRTAAQVERQPLVAMTESGREIELKFHCAPEHLPAVLAAAPVGAEESRDLISVYFDTPDR